MKSRLAAQATEAIGFTLFVLLPAAAFALLIHVFAAMADPGQETGPAHDRADPPGRSEGTPDHAPAGSPGDQGARGDRGNAGGKSGPNDGPNDGPGDGPNDGPGRDPRSGPDPDPSSGPSGGPSGGPGGDPSGGPGASGDCQALYCQPSGFSKRYCTATIYNEQTDRMECVWEETF